MSCVCINSGPTNMKLKSAPRRKMHIHDST